MRTNIKYPLFIFLLVIWMLSTSFLEPLPLVANEEEVMFRIERSRDADEVWYTMHTHPDGSVNQETPLIVFWMKKSADNRIEPLTGIQKRFSYGIQSIEPAPSGDAWSFQLAAYKNRSFLLKKSEDGRYSVFTRLDGREIEVRKLYVKFDGGTFLAPSVAFVQLTGTDRSTGAEIQEIITGSNRH